MIVNLDFIIIMILLFIGYMSLVIGYCLYKEAEG